MKFFFNVLFKALTSLLSMVLVVAVIFVGLNHFNKEKKIKVTEKNTILEVNLHGYLTEKKEINIFNTILNFGKKEKKVVLWDLLETLNHAKEDKNISGIMINLDNFDLRFAQIEEIRNAIINFKKSGKFVIVYGEYMFNKDYYLASSADYIFLHPSGMVALTGFSITKAFYKGLLEKLNSDVVAIKIGKYKSYTEAYTRKNMSPEDREQLTLILETISNSFISAISEFSNQKFIVIKKLLDDFEIATSHNALKFGIVSHLGDKYEIKDFIKKRLNISPEKKLNIVESRSYFYTKEKKKSKIVILPMEGIISRGESRNNTVGSDSITKAIEKIKEDKDIKGVIIRVNSPGGCAIASDIIWREISELKREKAVVTSMSGVAASGGYYIAMAADRIFAYKTTITGSIGVLFMKFEMEKFFVDILGMTKDNVKTEKYGDSSMSPFSTLKEIEKSIIQKNVEIQYDNFISKVAKSRGLSILEVDKIAQGRVWSGEAAVKNKLVNEIGGIEEAIKYLETKLELSKKDYELEVLSDENMELLSEYLSSVSLIFKNIRSLANFVATKFGIMALAEDNDL